MYINTNLHKTVKHGNRFKCSQFQDACRGFMFSATPSINKTVTPQCKRLFSLMSEID